MGSRIMWAGERAKTMRRGRAGGRKVNYRGQGERARAGREKGEGDDIKCRGTWGGVGRGRGARERGRGGWGGIWHERTRQIEKCPTEPYTRERGRERKKTEEGAEGEKKGGQAAHPSNLEMPSGSLSSGMIDSCTTCAYTVGRGGGRC